MIDPDKDKLKQIFHLKLHDYQINYVNIVLPHQYGISDVMVQTSLLRRGSREDDCIRSRENDLL